MQEAFVKPAVGAILVKKVSGQTYILLQQRGKEGGGQNGLWEFPAGKVREYENVYDALHREIWEGTGLTITRVLGEDAAREESVGPNKVLRFQPFCMTQNLSGASSLLLCTFICEAEGEPLPFSSACQNVHWEKAERVREMLQENPEQFFLMHVPAFKQYFQMD